MDRGRFIRWTSAVRWRSSGKWQFLVNRDRVWSRRRQFSAARKPADSAMWFGDADFWREGSSVPRSGHGLFVGDLR